ncbi:hypothetical protein SLEP1_g58670 [Rubroshorea leprosula]|uniref:Uncharacterized protein n=1 Tax=Rubroshorea leprosula TaxID=152421 RepID=A0AAV5IKH5_9ROSI|nr:hypothetical protein SLEP1_g13110 [Rubroshorea leprosula]GKV52066.1 hypothetical protein SLEP1_g58670 [Rubroshorea leprosula]
MGSNEAYNGESCDLMFTVAMFQMKTKLQVLTTNNPKEYDCDYRVGGNFLQDSYTVYVGETNTIVAQGKGRFAVTVYPNADHAFIAALILDGMNRPGWI